MTVTVGESVAVSVLLSVAVMVMVYGPATVYVCDAPVVGRTRVSGGLPSPQFTSTSVKAVPAAGVAVIPIEYGLPTVAAPVPVEDTVVVRLHAKVEIKQTGVVVLVAVNVLVTR